MEGKTTKWNIGLLFLLAHLSSSFIMDNFFFNRALVCFLIPHSFSEQLQHARHCYRY